jgi:hypothetical protein
MVGSVVESTIRYYGENRLGLFSFDEEEVLFAALHENIFIIEQHIG